MSDSSQNLSMQRSSSSSAAASAHPDFTPAFPILALYDPLVRLLTRERAWRSALLARLAPEPGELIVDAGCGTASFLAAIGRCSPDARLIGIDPDARILERARAKLARSETAAELHRASMRGLGPVLGQRRAAKIISSLVFHQIPMAEKQAGLAALFDALAPGGMLLIADYGWQRTATMRRLFRIVQRIDGFADTQPNADGMLPSLIAAAGFVDVAETDVFPTATGSISLYRARKPAV